MFRTIGSRVPPPQGVRPVVAWGDPERVSELLGPFCSDLQMTRRTCAWRFPSSTACLSWFRTWYGPTVAAFAAVGDNGQEELGQELVRVFDSHNCTDDGTLAVDVDYLEVIARRA